MNLDAFMDTIGPEEDEEESGDESMGKEEETEEFSADESGEEF